MTLFSARTMVLASLLLTTAGTAMALSCQFVGERAVLTTVSTLVDGEASEDMPEPAFLLAVPGEGLHLEFDDGDTSYSLYFQRVEGGAQ
jgi:hypothetical protein